MEKLNRKSFYKLNQEIYDKMKAVYLSCPSAVNYVKKLDVPDELVDKNIDIVYDFALDIKYCEKCPGLDNCYKENPHLCTKITYQDGYLERLLTPCRRLFEKTKVKNQFIVQDFDDSWLDKSLKDLDKHSNRKEAIKIYNDYIKGKSSQWMYLQGIGGTGKSFLAANLCVDAAKRDKGPICYLNTGDRFRKLADLNYKKSELFQTILNQYIECPILVLDDFGSEYKNDFVRDVILYEIVSKRAAKKLFTIFVSDFTLKEVEEMYATNKNNAVRARQIARLIKNNIVNEINLGELAIYR